VEHFIDADAMSDQDIAELIRRREIDVVVDLMGFTVNNRLDALARRPAPVQVNYLGYPGTTGADYVDYIIADQTTIPQDQCRYYSEQVVWLPACYQVNDNKRRVAEPRLTRAQCGLPEQAFVFCSFNNTFKFTPAMFDIWMRLLDAIPDSVLWLFEGNSPVSAKLCRDNLSAEAEKRGVSARRLVFAPRVDVADHLARQRNADLFLDTLPYNAHTTASDALWVGLPLVTCLGATFAGRVAASLLQAVGLDELVTHSLADYEALALKLAREPATLAAIRAKLLRNRDTSSLFDSAKVTRQIEAAYTAMWDRYRRGERPQARADGSKPIIIPR
jgi:predicted O-linked N-acetylglucosamine transferase (SPINDLY family)